MSTRSPPEKETGLACPRKVSAAIFTPPPPAGTFLMGCGGEEEGVRWPRDRAEGCPWARLVWGPQSWGPNFPSPLPFD